MSEVDAWDTYQWGFGQGGDKGWASKQAYKAFMAYSKANDKSVAGWAIVGAVESVGGSIRGMFPHVAGEAGGHRVANVYTTFREGGNSVPKAIVGTAGMSISDVSGATDVYEIATNQDTNRIITRQDYSPAWTTSEKWTKGFVAASKGASVGLVVAGFSTPGAPPTGVGPGMLTEAEATAIQRIANKYNTKIDVVGSRAAGGGRAIETTLPVGKELGKTRSDIDFRIDTSHPEAAKMIEELKAVGGGAGSAGTEWSTTDRPSYAPVIEFRPEKK
jgi:hypothetical protein